MRTAGDVLARVGRAIRHVWWFAPWPWLQRIRRLARTIRRDLSYTAEYRMGPDAWEQNGNNWRERRRFRAWIDAG